MTRELVIGSRGSALAMWQSRAVAALLEREHAGLTCRIEVIRTTGDQLHDASLVAISGKGAFTKEIEDAMLEGRVDLAVHSLKDLPTSLPEGLALGAITEREDPRDALVARPGVGSLRDVPKGGRIGTSSPRRRAQLAALRPDIELVELRGNVDTRLRKIETEGLAGVLLACAGLKRLGFAERITEALSVDVMVPAVGQGALGIEIRQRDQDIEDIVRVVADLTTDICCRAERAFLGAMGGGCALPIAAHGRVEGLALRLIAAVAENGTVRREEATGDATEPEALGASLAAMFAKG